MHSLLVILNIEPAGHMHVPLKDLVFSGHFLHYPWNRKYPLEQRQPRGVHLPFGPQFFCASGSPL